MTIPIGKRGALPQLNTLAACLALVFSTGVGASSTLAAQMTAPRSNHHAAAGQQRHGGALHRARLARHRTTPATTVAPARPATVLTVTSCLDDASGGTLREVLASAISGDVIDMSGLACPRITLTGGELTTSYDVTLRGPGQDELAIDGNDASRVLSGGSLTVENLSLVNGRSDADGGCVYAADDLRLTDATISGCHVGDGTGGYEFGGGARVDGNLWMESSTISGNTASGLNAVGGGGAFVGSSAYLTDSTISGNSAVAVGEPTADYNYARGGGLFVANGLYLDQSVITANSATSVHSPAYGGGVHVHGNNSYGSAYDTRITATASTISGNTAHSDAQWSYGGGLSVGNFDGYSGAIDLEFTTLSGNMVTSSCTGCTIQGGGANAFGQITVLSSTVRDNTAIVDPGSAATAYGGGLTTRFNQYYEFVNLVYGRIQLRESTISGNAATGGATGYGRGGGIAALMSPVDVRNSTLAFNQASTSGGGILEGAGSIGTSDYEFFSSLAASIVSNNQAPRGADIASVALSNQVRISEGENIVIDAAPNIVFVDEAPLTDDPGLLPLACNGGPTATHALGSASIAIDATSGSNDEYDQRGDPYVRISGAAPDIGAFELQPGPDRIFVDGFDATPPSSIGQACGSGTGV